MDFHSNFNKRPNNIIVELILSIHLLLLELTVKLVWVGSRLELRKGSNFSSVENEVHVIFVFTLSWKLQRFVRFVVGLSVLGKYLFVDCCVMLELLAAHLRRFHVEKTALLHVHSLLEPLLTRSHLRFDLTRVIHLLCRLSHVFD